MSVCSCQNDWIYFIIKKSKKSDLCYISISYCLNVFDLWQSLLSASYDVAWKTWDKCNYCCFAHYFTKILWSRFQFVLKETNKFILRKAEAFRYHESCIHDCFGVCTRRLLRTFLNLFSALRQDNMQNQNLIGSKRHHNNAALHCPRQNLYTSEHFLG